MKRDSQLHLPSVLIGMALMFAAVVIAATCGCTPHAAPIDMMPQRVDETPQRTIDLQHPCERCGEPATENVSEVADEQNWRCDKCKPRDVRPRLQRKPKLERQWVMR